MEVRQGTHDWSGTGEMDVGQGDRMGLGQEKQLLFHHETHTEIAPPTWTRSQQHQVCSNSKFDLHSPKALHCCFHKQHGHVLCSHFVYFGRRHVCAHALIG